MMINKHSQPVKHRELLESADNALQKALESIADARSFLRIAGDKWEEVNLAPTESQIRSMIEWIRSQ